MKELREMLGLLRSALAERDRGGGTAAAPEDDLRDLERQIARQKKVAQVRLPLPAFFGFACIPPQRAAHPGTREVRAWCTTRSLRRRIVPTRWCKSHLLRPTIPTAVYNLYFEYRVMLHICRALVLADRQAVSNPNLGRPTTAFAHRCMN